MSFAIPCRLRAWILVNLGAWHNNKACPETPVCYLLFSFKPPLKRAGGHCNSPHHTHITVNRREVYKRHTRKRKRQGGIDCLQHDFVTCYTYEYWIGISQGGSPEGTAGPTSNPVPQTANLLRHSDISRYYIVLVFYDTPVQFPFTASTAEPFREKIELLRSSHTLLTFIFTVFRCFTLRPSPPLPYHTLPHSTSEAFQ